MNGHYRTAESLTSCSSAVVTHSHFQAQPLADGPLPWAELFEVGACHEIERSVRSGRVYIRLLARAFGVSHID
jgi:hypothetical protein